MMELSFQAMTMRKWKKVQLRSSRGTSLITKQNGIFILIGRNWDWSILFAGRVEFTSYRGISDSMMVNKQYNKQQVGEETSYLVNRRYDTVNYLARSVRPGLSRRLRTSMILVHDNLPYHTNAEPNNKFIITLKSLKYLNGWFYTVKHF